jgi:hypothetical protein
MEISDDDLDESDRGSGEIVPPTVAVEAAAPVAPPARMATIRDSPQWGTMTEEEKRKALHEERVRLLPSPQQHILCGGQLSLTNHTLHLHRKRRRRLRRIDALHCLVR